MPDDIAGTGGETAAAFGALAKGLGHRTVGFAIDAAHHRRQHNARPVFRCQQLQVEPQRAEPRLHRRMVQREQCGQMLVRIVLIGPRVDMGRRDDNAGISLVFQPIDKIERRFLEHRQGQFVVVVLVAFVPARDPGCAAGVALSKDNNPAGVMLRDIRRFLGEIRRRVFLEHGAIGNADQIDAEFPRLCLDVGRGQRRLKC